MSDATTSHPRVRVDGKFFRIGEKKFHLKGVAYGPFEAREGGECFPTPEQTARDFAQIAELGANLIRTYTAPPRWLLDLARAHGFSILFLPGYARHGFFPVC